jgi:predicted O-methyltransferase YrrM
MDGTTTTAHRMALSDRLSRMESSDGWRALAYRAYLAAHRGAERMGLHLVRASYDSPIPRRAELTDETFAHVSEMRGIGWDPAAQLDFVERELARYLAEFRPAAGPDAPDGVFRLDNRTYGRVDADLLYAIVRWAKPSRHVELGSGYSSLVAAEALAANARDGHPGEQRCYDPYPSPHVLARGDLAAGLEQTSAQGLPEDVVRALHAGDILFVDTSHTVKLGGDVNRIVLDLLPLVAPGVLVHFHDIFLPGEYSRGHLAGAHFWTEQYLLQAFLSGNAGWEVLVGAQAIVREDPARVGALVASYRAGVSPGAFWIRRRSSA